MIAVIVYTWSDFCLWLRTRKGFNISEADEGDPTMVRNHFANIQEWHKGLVVTLFQDYKIHFCDSKSGFIVFESRLIIAKEA